MKKWTRFISFGRENSGRILCVYFAFWICSNYVWRIALYARNHTRQCCRARMFSSVTGGGTWFIGRSTFFGLSIYWPMFVCLPDKHIHFRVVNKCIRLLVCKLSENGPAKKYAWFIGHSIYWPANNSSTFCTFLWNYRLTNDRRVLIRSRISKHVSCVWKLSIWGTVRLHNIFSSARAYRNGNPISGINILIYC